MYPPKNNYSNPYQDEKHLDVTYHLYEEYKPQKLEVPLEYEKIPPIIVQTIPHYSISNNYYPSLPHKRQHTNTYGTTHAYSKVC